MHCFAFHIRYLAFTLLVLAIDITCFGQSSKRDSLEALLPLSSKNENRVDILNQLATAIRSSAPKAAISYAVEARTLADSLGYSKGLMLAYQVEGLGWGYNNDYQKAINLLLKSNELARKLGDMKVVASNTMNIASAYYVVLNDYDKALEYYLQTLKIYEGLNDKKGIAQSYSGIGITYVGEKRYDEGMKMLIKALSMFEELGEKQEIAKMHVNIGNGYADLSKFKEALSSYEKALALFKERDVTRGISHTLYRIGHLYWEQKDFQNATLNLKEALSINEKLNNKASISDCIVLLSKVYIEKKMYDDALPYTLRAIDIAKELKKREALRESYLLLSRIYKEKKDYSSALQAYEMHHIYHDSIYNAEKSKQMNELQQRYEAEKKEKEIELLKKENLLDRIYLTTAIASVVLIGLLAFLVVNRQRIKNKSDRALAEKENQLNEERRAIVEAELRNKELSEQQLQKELEFKNKELASYTLNLIQKNETLENLKSGIEELKAVPEVQMRSKLNGLLGMVNYSFQIDKEWENFKLHFEQVHQNFFKKLIEQYPDLSGNDLKMAALIRLNLDNRGVAAILNISQESAKVARHRFRKKLNLPAEQNLLAYLNSID